MTISRRHLNTAALLALLSAAHPRISSAAQQESPLSASSPWPTASLSELGFASNLGEQLTAAIPNFPAVTGVCVIRQGMLATEHYAKGYDGDTLVNIRSVTKSVTSTLVGIALERADLSSIDVTVGEVIPQRIPPDADPAVAALTMRSFLSMSSGLWWDGHDDWPMLLAADDWVANTLRQPIVASPGTQFVYNTGGSHLVGVMLAEIVGQPLETYAADHLFGPLGIVPGPWMRSPQGEVNGGSGLELLPRDMAKLGYLLGRSGRWNDLPLVQPDYALAATTRQSDGEAVTGGSIGVAYGFQWWITDDTGYTAFFALGFGGQYVYVVPELDLVVVVAAGFDDEAGERPILTSHRPIPEQIVIPAILNSALQRRW
jgi:CubicO group peptidase (beta-lactamase class C family)